MEKSFIDISVNLVSMIFSVATLLALWYAVVQSRYNNDKTEHLAKALANLTQKTSEISDAVSTSYIGAFPAYFGRLKKLLAGARQELLILCTIPSHGVFTAHDEWFEMKQEIEKAISSPRNVQIHCVFSEATDRLTFLQEQFREALKEEAWPAWRSKEEKRLQEFIRPFPEITTASITPDLFREVFESYASHEFKTTYNGAEIVEVSDRLPIWMWIADGMEAIVAIPTTTTQTFLAQAFWTTDQRLITALTNMYNEYKAHGTRYVPGLAPEVKTPPYQNQKAV